LIPRLLAFISRWRKAKRAARLARIDRIIGKGFSTIE
jgi:hypothetical protein